MKNVGNIMPKGFSLMALLCMVVILACNNGARKNVGEENKAKTAEDSFTVVYSKPIKGYRVRAVLKPYETDVLIMKAAITFDKDGKLFTLKTSCYGDTAFCKGRLEYREDNEKLLKKYRNKTVKADYNEAMPFFFKDMDFDGVDELVIVHYSMADRYHNGYDVYRIVDGKPMPIDYPPYKSGKHKEFGMTDYPEFDFKHNTITCSFPEGELKYEEQTVYGISDRKKDTIVVNGVKHYFNHIEQQKRVSFSNE